MKRKGKSILARQLRYRSEYFLHLFFSFLVRFLPAGGVYRLGKFLGSLAYRFADKRKRIARTNLDIAFGESKTPQEKERIIKRSFIQVAVSGLQCLWLGSDPENKIHELIDQPPEGLETLKRCLERGKGVFFLTAHYGNWEAMGVYHGYMGIARLCSIARRLDNPYLEKIAMKLRTVSGNDIFYKEQSPIKIVRALKNNCCVAVMMDQNMAKGGVFVDFFGKKAASARSIAALSQATGSSILPLFSYPKGDGRYAVRYGPELSFKETGDKETDILNCVQECEKYLESVIREYPEPWMWGHRRWKTRPPEENGLKLY
ncbi:MAG: lysophospholipid acyltransferase family protein [Nitrospinae bacterium]|nr:lysophospholipid acyltransferase family protein [Nitrospinota bacterium]